MLRLGIPFTAGQILLYLIGHAPNFSPLGIGDKVVQGALAVFWPYSIASESPSGTLNRPIHPTWSATMSSAFSTNACSSPAGTVAPAAMS